MQPDLIGGRYRVVRAIGQGGMGTVWLCRDEVLHREVAVKQVGLLPGESSTDSVRALREARSTAALSHRNVVTVFDVVEEDGAIWLVMEHVPGRSLSEIIREEGALEPAVAADIGAQVAEGLAAAHAAGTMHRDVKPGNVLVREDGTAKISDFGIARTHGDPALTQSGFLTGTPSYFSPELARGGEPGPENDVWALGATLYAAVEGRPPYPRRENPVAVLHDITTTQPPPPRRADGLEPALLRMMDRDPRSRWSMDDAAHGLRRVAGRLSPPGTLAQPAEDADDDSAADTGHDTGAATTVASAPAAAAATAPARGSDLSDQASTAGPPARDNERTPARAVAPPLDRSGAAFDGPDDGPHDGPDDTERKSDPRRRRAAYVALVALALLVVLGGVAYVASLRQDDPGTAAGASDSSGPSASHSPSRKPSSTSPSQEASQKPSDTPSQQSQSPSSGATGASAAQGGAKAFLSDYFAAAPGGTERGWSMLTSGYQDEVGHGHYVGFWRTISSVQVGRVTDAGGGAVLADLTYTRNDGSSTTERHQLDLVRNGGSYLIAGDQPA